MAWWNRNPEPVNSVLPDPRGALPWMVTSLTCAVTLEVALVGILGPNGCANTGERDSWSMLEQWDRGAGQLVCWSSGGDRPTLSLPTQSMILRVLIDHPTACSKGPVVSHLSK